MPPNTISQTQDELLYRETAGVQLSVRPAPKKRQILLALVFVLLFTSFHWDIFGIEKARIEENIELVDVYIVPALHFYVSAPNPKKALGVIMLDDQEGGGYRPYYMQVGLQRILYTLLSPNSAEGVDRAVPRLRTAIEAALALILTIFIAAIDSEFGHLTAGITAALLALSNWLIVFAPDLFWISATFFAPFALGWLLGDPARPVSHQRALAVSFTAVSLIKCLCGYDYLTNVCGAIAVPLLYYGLVRGQPMRAIAARIAKYAGLTLLAFFMAVALQAIQFAWVQKDVSGGLFFFLNEAKRRTLTNGEGFGSGYQTSILSMLHKLHLPPSWDPRVESVLTHLLPVARYFKYLGMGALTVPFPRHPLTVPIGVFVLGFSLLLLLKGARMYGAISSGSTDAKLALATSTIAALFISHVWVVAANGHMTHTFFNAIVFYIPFLPMAYVTLGATVSSLVRRLRLISSPQESAAQPSGLGPRRSGAAPHSR
jgi:hypothetical protein